MIGYVTLGSNDFEKSLKFYDELLGLLNAERAFNTDRFVSWTRGPGQPMLSIVKPYDGNAATVGNGVMVALTVENTDQVEKVYAKALELGASDEGAPGERIPGFYGAYFRDLDGNKLCVFNMDMSKMG